MDEVSMERHGRAKQLVVFFGAASIGPGGGDSDPLRGRVVLVDEHHTTRVSSAVNGKQPCEEEVDHEQPTRRAGWKPQAGQVDLRLLRPAWSQQRGASSLEPPTTHTPLSPIVFSLPALASKATTAAVQQLGGVLAAMRQGITTLRIQAARPGRSQGASS
ncbi:hypothetical protein QJQ45_005709 [Haematococcus lacustris]|nr:hypothetical protein QJQ45_005709 [Haematococcus lacustris]